MVPSVKTNRKAAIFTSMRCCDRHIFLLYRQKSDKGTFIITSGPQQPTTKVTLKAPSP